MRRPKLWLLHHKSDALVPCECGLDNQRLVADDDGSGLWVDGRCRCKHVVDHRESGDTVKHFRERGPHARPFAGREDHDVDVHFLAAWGPTPTPDALALWRSRVSRTGRPDTSPTPDALALWRSGVSRTERPSTSPAPV